MAESLRDAGFVYLHGFASGPASAKAVFFRDRLAELGIELELPDLNAPDFRGLTISRSLEQVRGALEKVGADRRGAVVIGSSLGGYTAALAASRDPRIRAIVLMAPAFDLPARWTQWLSPEGIASWRATRELEVDHHAYGRKEKVGFGLYLDAMGHQPYPRSGCPALVLHGVNDVEVPVGTSRKYAELTPESRLIELESDHGLLDVTDRLWSETRAFLGI